ncbi:hypothetical protein BTVI_01983 [Pitangus sulphuratus]|nr:hypothetical protein BTVI_126551 [Pitangus sulphuratus]KAJ7426607.1 hypothetical protein BTVI_01983 [Pitangus sulphuratus]
MTPFWRGVSLRPIGASCRDNSECITMLCRCELKYIFSKPPWFSLYPVSRVDGECRAGAQIQLDLYPSTWQEHKVDEVPSPQSDR